MDNARLTDQQIELLLKLADSLKRRVSDKLDDVFVDAQTFINIDDGGICPALAMDLENAFDNLKNVFFEILKYQLLTDKTKEEK